MDIQLALPDCTLSTEEGVLVRALNQFLAWLPAEADPDVAFRLAAMILETTDVATQTEWAQATGFSQPRLRSTSAKRPPLSSRGYNFIRSGRLSCGIDFFNANDAYFALSTLHAIPTALTAGKRVAMALPTPVGAWIDNLSFCHITQIDWTIHPNMLDSR